MRWSERNDDNLDELLRAEDGTKLAAALAEMREKAPDASSDLRERIRGLAAEEGESKPRRRLILGGYRPSLARAGALAAAVLLIAVAIPIAATRDGGSPEASSDAGSGGGGAVPQARRAERARQFSPAARTPGGGGGGYVIEPPSPSAADGGSARLRATERDAPLPSPTRAQDYTASIKLHVADHDELSKAVQSAIRSTRQLGGYVTYVDYGTSGEKDGEATLAVRVPIGRLQAAVGRFSELGTILEQQTEIVDLQGRIDRITRDVRQRRDRIAKLEAQLKDPTLSATERTRLEARIVQAKRGLANAQRDRTGVLRQSRFAKLDLAFTTEKREEPAAPPSDLEQTLDDAAGILVAELGILLFLLIAGAPFIALALLAWFGARAGRRAASQRVLERA